MVQEVKDRIDLIVSVQGSHQISRQNLEFLFEKYELPEDERQQVRDYCEERHIRLFDEGEEEAAQAAAAKAEQKVGAGEKNGLYAGVIRKKEEPVQEKKGFFARLFGR